MVFIDELNKRIIEGRCVDCGQHFVDGVNVFSDAGWRETEISQTCEKCFDALCEKLAEADVDLSSDHDDEPAF